MNIRSEQSPHLSLSLRGAKRQSNLDPITLIRLAPDGTKFSKKTAMMKEAHPLELVRWLAEQHRNRNATTTELIAVLEKAPLTMEEEWKWNSASGERMRCHFPGCNYHRYLASRFCMYHVTGHDTFAARLRRSIKRDKARGVDVSEFDGILRLITENIVKRIPDPDKQKP